MVATTILFAISSNSDPVKLLASNARLTDLVIALFCSSVDNKLLGKPNVAIVFKFIALPVAIKSCPNILVDRLTPVISPVIKSSILLNVPSKNSCELFTVNIGSLLD